MGWDGCLTGVNARGVQDNLWPKSFLERPVARHFVWLFYCIRYAVSNLQKTRIYPTEGLVGIAQQRERFTSP